MPAQKEAVLAYMCSSDNMVQRPLNNEPPANKLLCYCSRFCLSFLVNMGGRLYNLIGVSGCMLKRLVQAVCSMGGPWRYFAAWEHVTSYCKLLQAAKLTAGRACSRRLFSPAWPTVVLIVQHRKDAAELAKLRAAQLLAAAWVSP